jgi:predicted nucleotidyltransferase
MIKQSNSYPHIRSLAKRIGDKFHPKQIILFGSHARGTASRQSDVDLLVIFARQGDSFIEEALTKGRVLYES